MRTRTAPVPPVPRALPSGVRVAAGTMVLAAALASVLAQALAPTGASAQDADASAARAAALSGDWDRALRGYAEAADPDAPAPLVRERVRLLLTLSRHDAAVDAASGPDGRAASPALETVLGEALYARGDIDAAEAAFRRALEAGAPDRNVAAVRLAVLRWNRGERDEALESFDSFIDLYNRSADRLGAEELAAVAEAVRYLGVRNPDLFRDALMAWDEAIAAAGGAEESPLAQALEVRVGELFLEKYDAPEAHASFDRVLAVNPRHPGALLGKARALDFDGVGGSLERAGQAAAVAPDDPGVRAFTAALHLKTASYREAFREAERALAANPAHLGALSVLAAAHHLSGDMAAFREVRERALALNPAYGELDATVAALAVDQRRYHDAVELARRAVALDSTLWRAWGVLGTNQLRTGSIEEGRANLERAFAGDPFNVWFKNSLDLLDTFDRYETVRTEHFELFLHGEEAALLGPYVAEVAEEAFAALSARYGAEPPTPVRLELFPSHADFSVRTLGLVGLGALGVSFGSTLVMDSPSAREAGDFNWASTVWHELAHAFHLAMSDHRVPRWFSEGLAVHEQRQARPRWGYRATPAWLQAWRGGRLKPVSELDEGFVRPDYPEQVGFSYYQASLVFRMIEARWGFDAVLAMLDGYREGRITPELVPEVLGLSPGELDDAFEAYVEERLGERADAVVSPSGDASALGALLGGHGAGAGGVGGGLDELADAARRDPGSFPARLAYGRALAEAGRVDEAEEELRAALRLFPEYGGLGGPYAWLARIHRDRGEIGQAADALYQLGQRNQNAYRPHLEEAQLRLELADTARAADALARTMEVFPYDVDTHRRLAELLEATGRWDDAVLERRAVLALEPVDEADARYRLARVLHRGGRSDEARSELLRALEIAPSFPAALDLLLELREGGP